MSENDGTQASTKRSRSRKTRKQNGTGEPAPQRPINDDKEAWKAYWKNRRQPWRTEPEIDEERQKYLSERCDIKLDIEQAIYLFKDIQLSRADVEWLLATHEKGRGPVDWSDESQRKRVGLDLRGADLRQVDLSRLPLTCIQGGLKGEWWNDIPDEQLDQAAVHLEGADLRGTHLEGAELNGAHLEGADLRAAPLEYADFCRAHLESVRFIGANLENAYLRAAHLERTSLFNTN